jgi:PAS domain S-box-containing protein
VRNIGNKTKEKYRTIFENTGTATIIVEEDTTISLVNGQFEELSGYSREEIEWKKSWIEFVIEEDLERMKKLHYSRRKDPESTLRKYEFRFVNKEGNVRDILLVIDMIPGTKKA